MVLPSALNLGNICCCSVVINRHITQYNLCCSYCYYCWLHFRAAVTTSVISNDFWADDSRSCDRYVFSNYLKQVCYRTNKM